MSEIVDSGCYFESVPKREHIDGWTALPEYLTKFTIGFSRDHQVLAMQDGESGSQVHLVVCNEEGLGHADVVGRRIGFEPHPVRVSSEILEAAINRAYSSRTGEAAAVLGSLDRDQLLADVKALSAREDLLDTEGRAPIIRLVNHLLLDAVRSGASDVHIQPYEDRVVVLQRIDGVLFDSFEIPKAVQEEVLTRVKVLGKMNIAEKRLPQDGRATVTLGERVVDLRIASLPTSHNERIVIRLLDKSARLYTLGELGMPEFYLSQFRQLIRRDHGMILVTGPTGSGKSTTLYGALQEINTHDLNVLTLEDPIEYQLEGVSQTQINEKKGMTFASGMRSILRQDPDIIMVGEIRDGETSTMAIQASLTGHLMFSTLHTNDAATAVTRLLDLGTEPFLVASSLVASLAQRLVRKLCDHCSRPTKSKERLPPPSPHMVKAMGLEIDQLAGVREPVGCEHCRGTGYHGRVGLFELLVIDEQIRDLITNRANASEIRQAALEAGMELLMTDGITKVHHGVTTMEEVLRVTSS
ncbi:MAG: ATPase, T2SS/T4P/T4SS family [Planctomycetota bacterium]